MAPTHYKSLGAHLRARFGCRVQKISLDAGLSCPNRDGALGDGGCVYCNARGSGTGAWARGLSITAQLEEGKAVLARRYNAKAFIAYFQSFTNTYADLPKLERMYEEALAVEGVVGLAIGTRPDCVDEAVLDLLARHARSSLVWIEYGLQSAHNETLQLINRGHDFAAFERAVRMTRERGLETCAHLILGLPGEERTHMLATTDAVANLGIGGVKLHLLYVARGTRLHEWYESGMYRCLEQDEYVGLVCDVLQRLPPATVIHRLTGDPHRDELIAPEWSVRKGETLALIREEMGRRGAGQGGVGAR